MVLELSHLATLVIADRCRFLFGIICPSGRAYGAFVGASNRALSEVDSGGNCLQAMLDQTIAGFPPPENRDNFDDGHYSRVFRLNL